MLLTVAVLLLMLAVLLLLVLMLWLRLLSLLRLVMVALWSSPDGPLRPRSSSAAVSAVVSPAVGATKSPARAEEREAVALLLIARTDLQVLGVDSLGVELLLLSLESSGSLARSVVRSTGCRALLLPPTLSSPVPLTMV